jgi:hypothetical protein
LERNFDKAEPLLRNLVSDYGSPEDPRLTHVVQGAKNVLTTLAAERNR